MRIVISNIPTKNKSTDELIRNEKYKISGGSSANHTATEYKTLLTKIAPHLLEAVPFTDRNLEISEIHALKSGLFNRISDLLKNREEVEHGRPSIQFNGSEIKLDTTPSGRNVQDYFIYKLYQSYQICELCLAEGKAVYLTITME